MNIHNQADFLSLIENVDAGLISKHVSIDCRPSEAANDMSQRLGVKISFTYPDPPRNPASYDASMLGWHIYHWYKARYGDRATYDMDLGKVAFWLRGDVWFMRVPIIFDWANTDHLIFVESLTPVLRRDLSGDETEEIKEVLRLGAEAFTYMLMKRSATYVAESSAGHRSAVDFLKPPQQQPGQSKWASLEATEKIIKAFIISKHKKPKRIHDLVEVAKEAEALGLNQVDRTLLDRINCTTGARYGKGSTTLRDAIVAHQSALQVSLLVAVQIY